MDTIIYKMAATLLKSTGKTLGKVGIVAGAIVATASQGVWSTDNRNGLKAFGKVRNNVLDEANSYVGQIPPVSSMSDSLKTQWNTGVQTVFQALLKTPEKTANLARTTFSNISESVSSGNK